MWNVGVEERVSRSMRLVKPKISGIQWEGKWIQSQAEIIGDYMNWNYGDGNYLLNINNSAHMANNLY
jgi:hypothetical protein